MTKSIVSRAVAGAAALLVAGSIVGCTAKQPDYSSAVSRVEAAANRAESAANKAEAAAKSAADAAARAQAAASKAEARFGRHMYKK